MQLLKMGRPRLVSLALFATMASSSSSLVGRSLLSELKLGLSAASPSDDELVNLETVQKATIAPCANMDVWLVTYTSCGTQYIESNLCKCLHMTSTRSNN